MEPKSSTFDRRVRRGAVALLLGASAIARVLGGEATTECADPAPLTLYLGTDFTCEVQRQPRPVIWADNRRMVVRGADGSRVEVGASEKMTSRMVPRVGRIEATLEELKTEAFAAGQDQATMDAMQQQLTAEDIRESNAQRADARHGMARTAREMARFAEGTIGGPTEQDIGILDANVARAATESAAELSRTESLTSRDSGGSTRENALHVEFKISAPVQDPEAFGVLRLLVRDPANPRTPISTLKFFPIRRLSSRPVRVVVDQGGLPLDFQVEQLSLNIYANDRELPTTLSPNRLEVSLDEAHRFLVLNHVQAHRGASVPVGIARDLLPPALAGWIGPEQRGLTVDVAVDAAGRVTALVPAAGAGPTGLAPELLTALRDVRFLPALLNGVAVAGEGRFALGEFVP